uniref:Pre-rRNA-processing protein TSR1 homolog n=1 Tax=Trichuris muris TaxID=70415 RepID=A0A5S6PZK0_TRIMR
MQRSGTTVHRAGLLKQRNKSHNPGRHRSKGELDAKRKGRTPNILGIRKRCKTVSKKDRRNKVKQLRAIKQEQASERRGLANRLNPPVVVCIVSLSHEISSRNVLSRLMQGKSTGNVAEAERGLTFLRMPKLKSRFCFLCPDAADILDVLDSLKVADLVLLVWNGQGYQLGDYFSALLSSILAQGLPSFFNLLINPFERNSKYEQEKRCLAATAEKWGLQGRFYKLDTLEEQNALLRLMSTCSRKPLSIQEHRTRLLVESCSVAEFNSETNQCNVRVCGYVRGPNLDVNRLLHIPGWGDYQMNSIDVLLDPHPMHDFPQHRTDAFHNFAVADAALQECLYSEPAVEDLDFEQSARVTEAELQLEGSKSTEQLKQFFPKGTSEYQAAWMLDIDESVDGMSDAENVCADGTYDEFCSFETESLRSKFESECNEEMLDCEDTDSNYVTCEEEEEQNSLARLRQEREDKLFPDEMDTPANEPARVRFQKYRSLKSFRTSFWDPKENLPSEYAKIVHFKNFSVTKKRILEQEVKGALNGWYVAVYIKNVEMKCAEFLCNSSGSLVVYSLLPNEQKMALLNVVLRKHALCDQPIKSKDQLLFNIGYRRYFVSPVFSQHTNGNKHKLERFLAENATVVASFFAPVMFPPAGVSVFKLSTNGQLSLVATGSLMNVDADRVVLKRVVLSGHPYKINRRHAVVRYMFFNRDDVEWFRPVELRTRSGRRGFIREPVGTHGYMKCSFNTQLPSQDVVFIDLYKRVFPNAGRCGSCGSSSRTGKAQGIAPGTDMSQVLCSPIRADIALTTNCELTYFIQCEKAHVKQLLLELASDCLEARSLVALCQKAYIPALCVYNSGRAEKRSEAKIIHSVSQLLPLLKDIRQYIHRCEATIRRLIWCMHNVYYDERPPKWNLSHLHLAPVFEFLAQLLATLVFLELAIQQHLRLKEDWKIYSRFIKNIRGVTETESKMIKKVWKTIDEDLFSGHIFQHCAMRKRTTSDTAVNDKLMRQFSSMTKAYALKADSPSSYECDKEWHTMCACALLSFESLYFGRIDKKLLRFFWKRLEKASPFTLCCNLTWQPCAFLCQTVPEVKDIVNASSIPGSDPHTDMDVSVCGQIFDSAHQEFISLEVTINSMCQPESMTRQSPEKFTSVLFRVLQLSMEVKHESRKVISGWLKSTVPVEKYALEKCVRCLKAIKVMQRCLLVNDGRCAEFLFRSMQRVSTLLLKVLVAVRPSLTSDKRYSAVVENMIAAINAGLNALSKPVTVESWTVLSLAFSFGLGEIVPVDQMKFINELMDQMNFLISYRELFNQCFDCSFLTHIPLWKLNLSLSAHLGRGIDRSHLRTFLAGLGDYFFQIAVVKQRFGNSVSPAPLELNMLNFLSEKFLLALEIAVENSLRFSLFGNSQQDTLVSAKERLSCIEILRQLPFFVGARVVHVSEFVRRRLDETLYNLNTVASYDWQSYAEMRHLAKYGLQFDMNDPCLPCCRSDYGLDIVNMLRNFDDFVACYTYNADDQYFVAKHRKSKQRSAFGLQHALQSIRTHGLGVLSTTVSVAYKLLASKLHACLQLMLEGNFKDKVTKEMRFIRTLPSSSVRMYPYERAHALKEYFESSTGADGLNNLDRLRVLLTEIGNILGYVRLMQTAGFNMCMECLHLLPNCELNFARPNSSGTVNGADGLWSELANRISEWQRKILDHQDIFKLLVKAFATALRGDNFAGLENFYSIIPALTLNFAERSLICKQGMQRCREGDLLFSDDGFAIGATFLLHILDQFDRFTALRWFASISSKIATDKDMLMQDMANNGDKTFQQTVLFRIRRKEEFEQELNRISDAITPACVLFRASLACEAGSHEST